LLALLDKHPAPRLGTAIVGVLGDLGARSAAEKIRPLLDDVALRDAAAFTLARFGDAATMPRLLAMFGKDPGREVALAIVFGANGVEEAAPIFARTIAPIDGAPSDPTSFLRLARLLMRDPSFAAPLRANLDVLEKSKDVSADDRIAQRAEILQELASVDPVGQRDLLLAHLQDKEPSELQATLAAGLARAQEPRAFPILIAADTLADLGWYSSPQLMQRLDGLWLEAAEWEHVPMRVVAKSIATRLSIEIVFAPAVTAAQQREPIDMGEVYEFLPRGLRMRALAWLDMLGRHPFPGTGGARDASSALGWLPEDGKVRIVPRSEAAAFWRAEAERREKRPAKEPSSGK
jgi:hypothetical protein